MIDIINISKPIDQLNEIIDDRNNIIMRQYKNILTSRLIREGLYGLENFLVNSIRELFQLRLFIKIAAQVTKLFAELFANPVAANLTKIIFFLVEKSSLKKTSCSINIRCLIGPQLLIHNFERLFLGRRAIVEDSIDDNGFINTLVTTRKGLHHLDAFVASSENLLKNILCDGRSCTHHLTSLHINNIGSKILPDQLLFFA